ncbi:MAG: hypothetical protein WCN95_01360, partial [bacterium]
LIFIHYGAPGGSWKQPDTTGWQFRPRWPAALLLSLDQRSSADFDAPQSRNRPPDQDARLNRANRANPVVQVGDRQGNRLTVPAHRVVTTIRVFPAAHG